MSGCCKVSVKKNNHPPSGALLLAHSLMHMRVLKAFIAYQTLKVGTPEQREQKVLYLTLFDSSKASFFYFPPHLWSPHVKECQIARTVFQ